MKPVAGVLLFAAAAMSACAPRQDLRLYVFDCGRARLATLVPFGIADNQVLLVQLAETGPLVLSGDLYHFQISRERQRMSVFNVDSAQTLESMRRVEALLREVGAQLWIHHDPALFATLRKVPGYYR